MTPEDAKELRGAIEKLKFDPDGQATNYPFPKGWNEALDQALKLIPAPEEKKND